MEFSVAGKKAFAATGGKDFSAEKPVIMFVHGAGFDHTVWKLQTRYFAWHGYSVLAIDLPGHGRSEGPVLADIGAMAGWLIAAADALNIAQINLAGHSMGALVGLETGRVYADRVARLSLLGCSYPMPVSNALLDPAKNGAHLAMDLINSWGYGRAAQAGGHRMPGLWMMRGGLRVLEQSGAPVLFTDLSACNQYTQADDFADALTMPIQFILGGSDMMTPARAGQKMASALRESGRDVTVDLLPGIGHIMMEEAPDATLDALRRFF